MQIEYERKCSFDFVEVYGSLDDYAGPLYGRYCGSNVSLNPNVVFVDHTNHSFAIAFRL